MGSSPSRHPDYVSWSAKRIVRMGAKQMLATVNLGPNNALMNQVKMEKENCVSIRSLQAINEEPYA